MVYYILTLVKSSSSDDLSLDIVYQALIYIISKNTGKNLVMLFYLESCFHPSRISPHAVHSLQLSTFTLC